MQATRVGIDVGFGEVKIAWYEGPVLGSGRFPAILGQAEQGTKPSLGLGARGIRADTITYQDQTYLVGPQSFIESRLITGRQDSHRIGSVEERVLMLAALAGAGITTALVVTGLPVLWWNERRKLSRSWQGEHQIQWNSKPLTITIPQVRTVWQPLGTFYYRTLGTDGQATEPREAMHDGWAILDVGFNTTDISGLVDLRPVTRWCGGVRLGARDFLQIVAKDIENRFHVTRSIHEIAYQSTSTGFTTIYGQRYELSDDAWHEAVLLGSQIIAEATQRWDQGDRFREILITGGGSMPYQRIITKHAFPHNAVAIDQPVMANAIGFARYAQRSIWREYVHTT